MTQKQTKQKDIKKSNTAPTISIKTTFNRKNVLKNWIDAWKKIKQNNIHSTVPTMPSADVLEKLTFDGFSYFESCSIISSTIEKPYNQSRLLYLTYTLLQDNLGAVLFNERNQPLSYLQFFARRGLKYTTLIWMLDLPLKKIETIKNMFLPLYDENKKPIEDVCNKPLTGIALLEKAELPVATSLQIIATSSYDNTTLFLENLITRLTTPPTHLTIPFGLFSEIAEFSNYDQAPFNPRTGTSM